MRFKIFIAVFALLLVGCGSEVVEEEYEEMYQMYQKMLSDFSEQDKKYPIENTYLLSEAEDGVYDLSSWGLRFELPEKYENYNVFAGEQAHTNQEEEIFLVVSDLDKPEDVNELIEANGVYFLTYLLVVNNEEWVNEEESMDNFQTYIRLLAASKENFEGYGNGDYLKKIENMSFSSSIKRVKNYDYILGTFSEEKELFEDLNDSIKFHDRVETLNAWQSFEKPSDAELKESLSDLSYRVTQEDATERAFTEGNFDEHYEDGIYVDIVSGEPLFSSADKFDSKTGWPSFTKSISEDFIVKGTDYKLGHARTEVRSRYGDSHLGHLFKDGPEPLGDRWCINGAALEFVPAAEMEERGYGSLLTAILSS